jgi:hypothetical protein
MLAAKEIAASPQTMPPPQIAEPLLVLSQADFTAAVRDALHNWSRPDLLRANPLLRSRLLMEKAGLNESGAGERVSALRSLIREAAESLQASPREAKLYRALYHTYFHAAATQEQAAELLDLPFSTFRRHLKEGIARVVEILWQQEIGGWGK